MRKNLVSLFVLFILPAMIYSCQNADDIKQDMYYSNGRDLYIKHCQGCHGSVGEGLSALTPPLTDTVFLKQNKHQIACFIKYGVKKPMRINARYYDEKMPDFEALANIDIAQLIVYITNSYGNKQGMYHAEQVAADLQNCNK